MTQIGNNNETLPYCHQQSKPVDKYTYISHTSVIIEYYYCITEC